MRWSRALVGATTLLLAPSIIRPLLASTDPVDSTSPISATIPSLSVSGDTQAPTAPVLVRPVDSAVTSDTKPEFVWRRSVDAGSNTVFYTVYIDNIATYLGVSDLGNSSGAGYTARIDGEELKLLPTSSLAEGRHTWFVVAEDLSGNRRSSATWTLTVDTTPPFLILESLETYRPTTLAESPTFELTGPRDVHLEIATEPYSTVSVTIVDTQGSTLSTLSNTANQYGQVRLYYHLTQGLYSLLVTSLDRANLSTTLPEFFVSITQSSLPLPSLPGDITTSLDLPESLPLPPLPKLPSLQATISQVSSRVYLSITISIMIAVGLGLLLILAWKRRFNLLLLDSKGNRVAGAKIYHSSPHHSSQVLYTTNANGQAHIDGLSHYSTLTIIYNDSTILLSVSMQTNSLTITLN